MPSLCPNHGPNFLSNSIFRPVLILAAFLAMSLVAQAENITFSREFKTDSKAEVHTLKARDGHLFGKITFSREYAPGYYLCKLPYRTDAAWNAKFAAYFEYQGRKHPNPSPWQSFSSSSKWSKLYIAFKLEHKGIPVLVFNRGKSKHSFETLKIKNPEIVPFKPEKALNWFPGNGIMNGCQGALPESWHAYRSMEEKDNGLDGNFGYAGSSQVLKLCAGKGKPPIVQSMLFPFAGKGEIEFSVWAKAVDGKANFTMFLLGDTYKWAASKRFQLISKWKKFTVKRKLPEKINKSPYFWCRIDAGAKSHILIGKVELKLAGKTAATAENNLFLIDQSLTRNLIVNPEFKLGYWGWNCYNWGAGLTFDRLSKLLKRGEPVLVKCDESGGIAMRVNPFTSLTSFCFPIKSGSRYTISLDMKNANPGKNATCQVFFLDSKWKNESKNFKLNDKWTRYSFSFDWPYYSRRGVAYVRMDPKNNPVLIDKVQVERGSMTQFSATPVQLGLVNKPGDKYNIFSAGDKKAMMLLKAVCAKNISGKIKISANCKDAWNNTVFNKEFQVDATTNVEIPLSLNKTGRSGVFEVTMTALDATGKKLGTGLARYAVCHDLSGLELPDNPVAGHFQLIRPYEQITNLMPVLKKYFRINSFNRSFLKTKYVDDKRVVQQLNSAISKWTWPKSIKRVERLGFKDRNKAWVKRLLAEKTVAPDVMKEYLTEVKQVVTAFKGKVNAWELFNEPHLWRVKTGPDKGKKTMSPEKTASLYKAAYPVIKSIDSSAMVVGPCTGLTYPEWTNGFLKAGGAKYIDAFTFHGYCDSPDLIDMYGKIMDYRKQLAAYGRLDIPVWNTEQYFSVQLPYIRQHEGEYFRHYFKENEIDTAAVLGSGLIHHAAAGSRYAVFAFESCMLHGRRNEMMINFTFGVCNAAAYMLGNAGTGHPVELGAALKCFIFPQAKDGVLATINTIGVEASGEMEIPNGVKAFDMMGNLIKNNKIKIQHTPVYLCFKSGIPADEAVAKLQNTNFYGLGAPFNISVALTDKNNLTVNLLNRLNRKTSGTVTLKEFPVGWNFPTMTLAFKELSPGKSKAFNFRISNADIKPLKSYSFKFRINTSNEFFTKSAELSALFATHMPRLDENLDFDIWKNAAWTKLDDNNLSQVFNPSLKWTGNNDLSAQIAYGWSKKGLGLAIIVTDDKFNFPDAPRQSWENDSVQVYFDMKNDATPESAARQTNTVDDASYQIGFVNGKNGVAYLDKAPAGRYVGEANSQTGIDQDVIVQCKKLPGNRLFYNIFFKPEALPLVMFKPGASFGTSLIVNDNDGKGRKAGVTLAPKGKQPYLSQHEYRDLILLP